MKLRKLLAATLALIFLAAIIPLPLQAQDNTNISLEQAIQTAKELFPVAAQYPDFVSEFSSSPQSSTWNLQWESSESGQGSLNVQIDASSGEIIRMYHWLREQPGQSAPASISAAEAQTIANRWLHKLLPDKASQLKMANAPSIIPLSNSGYSSIQITYQRMENGIPVLGDGVRMEVNARTRDISSYDLTWTNRPLTDPAKAVSINEAGRVFQTENMLKMQYFLPQNWLKSSFSQPEPVRLIYRIDHPSMGSIDALTGKPLILKEGQREVYSNDMAMKEMSVGGMGSPAPAASSLTPQEIAELEKNTKIITKEQAVARVKQWVDIPDQAIMNHAQLSRDWQNKDIRVWNLNWGTPQGGKDGKFFDMWARVDATTGRIYSFNQYAGEMSRPGTLTKEQATAIAQEFIKKIEPQLAGQVKISEEAQPWKPRPLTKETLPAQWEVQLVRQVNGVPFPNDGIRVTISGIDQKVIGYNLTWTEQKFPAVSQAMSAAKAYQTYLKLAPMTLCYTPITSDNGTREMVLVFKPLTADRQSEFAMIDAVSGTALNAMGSPLDKKPSPRTFNDAAGHFAEKEIQAIGQAGLMNEYGQEFKPGEIISNGVFLRAMLGAVDGIWSIAELDDDKVIKACQERGWIKDKADPKAQLSRQLMTEAVIRAMGLEKAARYSGIYKNPFPDDNTVNDAMLGYIALANGMGLLHVDKTFNGDEAVTRGEAAYTLVRSLKR